MMTNKVAQTSRQRQDYKNHVVLIPTAITIIRIGNQITMINLY